jgi:hypothetical protein
MSDYDEDILAWSEQQAADSFSPSMRQHIDLEKLYRRALRWLPPHVDGKPPLSLPASCPITLDELLRED